MTKINREFIGQDFEEFLEEEGILTECTAEAVKRIIAWQIKEEMKAQKVTKSKMATKMHTSRSALDRLLDDSDPSLTLNSLISAAVALGKSLEIRLV